MESKRACARGHKRRVRDEGEPALPSLRSERLAALGTPLAILGPGRNSSTAAVPGTPSPSFGRGGGVSEANRVRADPPHSSSLILPSATLGPSSPTTAKQHPSEARHGERHAPAGPAGGPLSLRHRPGRPDLPGRR